MHKSFSLWRACPILVASGAVTTCAANNDRFFSPDDRNSKYLAKLTIAGDTAIKGGCSPSCCADAVSLIGCEGMCVIEDVLSEDSIRGFTELTKMRVASGNCTEIKFGRHHCDMMRDAERGSLERLAVSILPIVEQYFTAEEKNKFRLTQLQLLNPESGSVSNIPR